MYIADQAALADLVARLKGAPLIALDTEFMREKTYFARLCLVQLATDDLAAIVDPLAIDDLTPLAEVLCDGASLKILHAGSQDFEILYRLLGRTVGPVFDTQVAATLAGFQQQVGYGALVREVLDVTIDKGDTYTDWARRPLRETQVEYALNDVRYLPEIYRRLSADLAREGRLEWLQADFAKMMDPAAYEIVPEEQWRRVKRVSSLNRRQLAVAREIAAWREREAMRRDIPKRWVLGDESVVEVARRAPKTVEELATIRGVSEKTGRGAARALVEAVARGLAVPEDELPSIAKRRRVVADVDGAVDLMVALVRMRARERGVAMPLLASRDDLERLAAGEREGSPLMNGWRRTMVGEELLRLLDGRLAFRLVDGALSVVEETTP